MINSVLNPKFDANFDEEYVEEVNEIKVESKKNKLRPNLLEDLIGRTNEKENLEIIIQAAKNRGEPLDHILLHGPPGLGKTTLACIIANEMNVPMISTSGPAIERKGDLVSILTNIPEMGILFIDEVHRLNKVIAEMLYSAMEDFNVDIIIGKGPSARTLKLDLNRFTVIGATTKISTLASPFRDRFGVNMYIDYYSYDELKELIKQKVKVFDMNIDDNAALLIARSSRRTPRIAIRVLKRIRDLANVNNSKKITLSLAREGLKIIGIDENGLDPLDRKIIKTMYKNFNGGPVGLNTLAAVLSEDEDTIRDVYEPFLIKEGFINRTAKGRMITDKSLNYLHKNENIKFN